jgi:hypothetical protein
MTAQPDTAIDMDALHDAIVQSIAARFPALPTVADYRDDRLQLILPAVLVELTELEPVPDDDPMTEQLAALARFDARIVLGFRDANVKREIRKLAAALGHHIHMQRWGMPVGPAEVTSITPDDFSPELDQFEVWRVEWQQPVHIGVSVWGDDGVTPVPVFSYSPDIGPANEGAYEALPGFEPAEPEPEPEPEPEADE